MSIWIFFILVTIPYPSLGLLHKCPPKDVTNNHCSCDKNKNVLVTCDGIKTSHEFQKITQSFGGYVIDRFTVKNSGELELVSGPFKKLYMHSVTFDLVEFGTLPMLVFMDGLEETLEELSIINSKVSDWIWEKGTHFPYLNTLRFDKTLLPSTLTKRMLSILPKKIKDLKMNYCGIKTFGENALRKFGLLERLELEGNHFSILPRSSLPSPARKLQYISLANSSVTTLPDDMFVQMRRLEFLFLTATQLNDLQQKTFEPVWEQLEEIHLNNILLKCDCETAWLLNATSNKIFKPPTCKSTGNEKPRLLKDFSYTELCP